MPDETTSNPAPADTTIPQAPETLNTTPSETVVAPAPVETPVAPVPVSEPIPEPSSGHFRPNDPIELAPAESINPAPIAETPAETPVAVTEPTPTEATTSEPTPTETIQPTPTEAPLVAESADSRLGRRVETPAPTPASEPVATPAPAPAQVIATVVTPIVAPVIAQTFTKSIRELFTKAQLSIQNRKRKKLDRILTLFAKQTMITNNEVERLLHVSDATATRYLSTLEKEGRIKQNKKTGKGVSYSKI